MNNTKQKRKVIPHESLSVLGGLTVLLRYMVVIPLRLLASLVGWAGRQLWRATKVVGRGAWWIAKVPWRITQWAFGFGELPAFENIYQRQAYLRIKGRYRRHWWRNLHTLLFFLFMLAALYQSWIIARMGAPYYAMSNLIQVGVWLVILLVHYAFVRTKDQEDEALEASLTQYRDAPLAEKRKHIYYEEVEEHVFDVPPDYSHLEEHETIVEDDPEWASTAAERMKARRRRD